jgi:hypothetical protein
MATIIKPQYDLWLHQLQQNYRPENLNLWDHWTHLQVNRPAWVKKDRLNLFFQNRQDLLKRGRLVWGRLVQANQYLFYPGVDDSPAEVLFYPDAPADFNPELLNPIAQRFTNLKGSQPDDPELATLAASLTDEYDRHFGLAMPDSLSPDFPTEASVIYVVRKYLPNGYLSQKILPLLIYPEQPRLVMTLPCRYWPVEMEDWWIGA